MNAINDKCVSGEQTKSNKDEENDFDNSSVSFTYFAFFG